MAIQFNLFLSNHCMVHEVLYTICTNIYNIHGTRELKILSTIIFFRKIFLPLQFKNITLKNIMIFIAYLTPIADMASTFFQATPSPSFDWEMVICGSKFNKYCSKFLGNRLRYFSGPNSVLKILYIWPLDDSLMSLCHFCIYWSLRRCSTEVEEEMHLIIPYVGEPTRNKNIPNTWEPSILITFFANFVV